MLGGGGKLGTSFYLQMRKIIVLRAKKSLKGVTAVPTPSLAPTATISP